MSSEAVRPLAKWPGGKSRLAPRILDAFPPHARNAPLYEPFTGSTALALAARAPSGVLADVNLRLIRFHEVVRRTPYAFHAALMLLPRGPGWRDHYARIRDEFNADLPRADLSELDIPAEADVQRAARFLWLNKAAFNGLYRENAKGAFNVPPGSYETLAFPKLDAILAVHRVFTRYTAFRCQDWRVTIDETPPGARLYTDPPYDPLSPTSAFTTYSRKPFVWQDQVDLANACAAARDRGVHVVASNHGTDRIRELWTGLGFTLRNVEGVKRSISCKGEGRGQTVPEVIFTSWAGAPGTGGALMDVLGDADDGLEIL